MIKQDFHISNIIARHLSGEITPEENAQLEKWRKADSAHEALFQKICSKENLKKHVESGTSFNTATGWMEVQNRIRKSNNRERMIKILSYAAAVLVPVFFVGISLKYTTHDYFSNKSVLIAQPILIPRGGEYALVLSDGTKVHLNSMSSLRFPVAFTTGKREVELQGEAYLEVSKTGQPFIVNANGMQVEVLGTTFNISAYPDEEYQTTLVNGSVKVSAEKGESLILKPSQQATIALGSNSIQVRTVDTSFYTSWVKGKINFKDQRLEDIMKTLSRWYDMNVVYENEKLKNIRFGCNLNRYEEITPFVKLLEKTEEVHVKIEGNTITFHN